MTTFKTIPIALLIGLSLVLGTLAFAQTDAPLDVNIERHNFNFTVMESSLVTYESAGEGFSAIYNSEGGGKGTHPDFGLLVYGASSHLFSTKEAVAAGLVPPVESRVKAMDIDSQQTWQAMYSAQMEMNGRKQSGVATVTGTDGKAFEVPYYIWSQTVGLRTAHALTYVVLHEGAFIHVQVESSEPLSEGNKDWVISKLELVEPEVEQPL